MVHVYLCHVCLVEHVLLLEKSTPLSSHHSGYLCVTIMRSDSYIISGVLACCLGICTLQQWNFDSFFQVNFKMC